MKWIPLFLALIDGSPAIIEDLDGPHKFDVYRECMEHVEKVRPALGALLRKEFPYAHLMGDCIADPTQ